MKSMFNKSIYIWGAIISAIIIVISLNSLVGTYLSSQRIDLTQEKLYTIADGTIETLKSIDEPIKIKVYYSQKLGENYPPFKLYYERLRTLLKRYQEISGGKLIVSFYNPEPYSEMEERAIADYIRGIPLNEHGEYGYFGLVANNIIDDIEVMPFMDLDRDQFLEYDITSRIFSLANYNKPVVGFISGLGIDGVIDSQGGATPPWKIMGQIREFFDIETLIDYRENNAKLEKIPDNIDVLFIVQPLNLTEETLYAIDQYALNGGEILIALDPATTVAAGIGYDKKIDLLLSKWGVSIPKDYVAGDIKLARPAQVGDRGERVYNNYVALLGLTTENINPDDVVVGGIDVINLTTSGIIDISSDSNLNIKNLFATSKQSMKIDKENVKSRPDLNKLLQDFKPSGINYNLAVRIEGQAESLYKELNRKVKLGINNANHIQDGVINVILVADVDFLEDQFWVNVKDYFGEELLTPFANNAAFVINAMENLSGASSLASLRARGIVEKPFVLINELELESEKLFREKERLLAGELKVLEDRMMSLESNAGGTVVLGEEDLDLFKNFRQKAKDVQQELRDVKLNLREDINRVNLIIKVVNIAGVPILFCSFGFLYFIIRRYRSAKAR
ncbi:GldG family protein [Hyphomicrobiales bacterium]|nr:GldG family protein [Hyphomicrobiales bacterium]